MVKALAVFDCGDVGRLRGPAAQERELEHLIESYAQHLDASSRTRATRPSLQNLVRPWSLRPPCVPLAARGLAETMIMERMATTHRKMGPRGQSFVQHVPGVHESHGGAGAFSVALPRWPRRRDRTGACNPATSKKALKPAEQVCRSVAAADVAASLLLAALPRASH